MLNQTTIPYKILLILVFFTLPVLSGAAEETLPPVVDIEGNTKRVVVIDPAHGGGDWGATIRGVHEKHITLELALLVRDKINAAEKDITAMVTREEDAFMKAEQRAGFANTNKGDAFISIHCDYLEASGVNGYRIYYQAGKPLEKPGEEEIELIRWKDTQRYHIDESMRFASYISQYMQAALIPEESSVTGNDENDLVPLLTRREKAVYSYILCGVNMPAIQMEVGNMNNKNDFDYLRDKETINRIAYHIKEGVIQYFQDKFFEENGGETAEGEEGEAEETEEGGGVR